MTNCKNLNSSNRYKVNGVDVSLTSDNTNIQDGTVSLSKLSTEQEGSLITWNSLGVAKAITPGTNGFVLVSNGTGNEPNYVDPQNLPPSKDIGIVIEPPIITAHQNNYNPANLSEADILFIEASGNFEIRGIQAPLVNRRITIRLKNGSGDIKFKNENANATISNRFSLEADVTIKQKQSATFDYMLSLSRWFLLCVS